MSRSELRRLVGRRLEELYRRQLAADVGGDATYYESGRGYVGRESAGAEAERFRHRARDARRRDTRGWRPRPSVRAPVDLQVFAFAVALEVNGRDRVLRHVGVEPSGDAFHSISFD